jgi:hypothetical protein
LYFVWLNYRQLIEDIDPKLKLPSRQDFASSYLDLAFRELDISTKEKLFDVEYICITGDGWDSRKRESFFGLTAHFITEQWEVSNKLLVVIQFVFIIVFSVQSR